MRLKELYEKYHDRVEFIVVYVKEAHASDRWWLGRSRTQRLVNDLTGQLARTDVVEPVTLAQRRKVAASCQASLFDGVVPLYVDRMDNQVAGLYTARPTRIYFIDLEGRVIYNPGIGPFGFNPEYLEPVIEKVLSQARSPHGATAPVRSRARRWAAERGLQGASRPRARAGPADTPPGRAPRPTRRFASWGRQRPGPP